MHGSIWTLAGDPDDLARRYAALVEEIGTGTFAFHACMRTDDGIVVIDTCPSKEAFDAFLGSDQFRQALERHGLPWPEVRDHPVVLAVAEGHRVDG